MTVLGSTPLKCLQRHHHHLLAHEKQAAIRKTNRIFYQDQDHQPTCLLLPGLLSKATVIIHFSLLFRNGGAWYRYCVQFQLRNGRFGYKIGKIVQCAIAFQQNIIYLSLGIKGTREQATGP